MTTTRRRVLRPTSTVSPDESRRLRRLERQRSQLDSDRQAVSRWMTKLKRAFHAIERLQARMASLERQLNQMS